MSNVHFTAVTNYMQYIRQGQPKVPSEQSLTSLVIMRYETKRNW